ncbi:hypothetical protein [Streptomyces sp. NPDC002176]|uniref:hypothetical protein n=1 Tax=Streptomyces sp. NPDC002176 TaxID=3364634 RepID=UPI003850ADAA
MPSPTPCLGPCNTAWRRAEHLLANTGTSHDIPAARGAPVHRLGCVERVRRHLEELPELLVAVSLEPLHGQRGTPTATTNSAPTDTTPRPGQAARLLTDLIVGDIAETADVVRVHFGLGDGDAQEAGP